MGAGGFRRDKDGVIILSLDSTRTITIKMDEQLVRQMDAFWRTHGYGSRSEFIRHAVKLCMEMNEECLSRIGSAR